MKSVLKSRSFGSPLTDYGIDVVLNSYYAFDANASEASRQIGLHRDTIRSYWRVLGLKVGKGVFPMGVERMVESYHRNSGVYASVSRETGYSKKSVSKYLSERGLKPKGKPGKESFSGRSLREAAELYLKFGKDANRVAEIFGVHPGTIRNNLKKIGVELKQERVRGERLDRILDFYFFWDGNSSRVATELKENPTTVSKIWRRYGLEPSGRQNRNYRGYENALEYFKHTPKFRGKSRTQIFDMDPSLYRKLKKEGNFEKSMPKSKRAFLDEKLVKEIRYFRLEKKLPLEDVASILGISISSVQKHSQ